MTTLTGKVAIVTGASRGIGCAIAERFARDGAAVVVNYSRSANQAKEVVATIESRVGQAVAIQADMGRTSEIRHLFRETSTRFGHVDILVNNAATFVFHPLAATTEEEFDRVFALNARVLSLPCRRRHARCRMEGVSSISRRAGRR